MFAHQGLVLHFLSVVQSCEALVIPRKLLVSTAQLFSFPYGAVPFVLRPRLLLLQLCILGRQRSTLGIQGGFFYLEEENGTNLIWEACRRRNKPSLGGEACVVWMLCWHLQVGIVRLQGCVVLLQGNSLPLQSEDLSLLTASLTLQLLQLCLKSLALCLQSCVLQERRRRDNGEDCI